MGEGDRTFGEAEDLGGLADDDRVGLGDAMLNGFEGSPSLQATNAMRKSVIKNEEEMRSTSRSAFLVNSVDE